MKYWDVRVVTSEDGRRLAYNGPRTMAGSAMEALIIVGSRLRNPEWITEIEVSLIVAKEPVGWTRR